MPVKYKTSIYILRRTRISKIFAIFMSEMFYIYFKTILYRSFLVVYNEYIVKIILTLIKLNAENLKDFLNIYV